MTKISAIALLLIVVLFIGNAAMTTAYRLDGGLVSGLRLASWWVVIASVCLIVTRVEGLPLESVGLRPLSLASPLGGVGAFVVAFLLAGLLARFLMPALGVSQDGGQAERIAMQPLAMQLALFATAAIVEELVCRGIVVSRLAPLSPTLAVIASVLVFSLPHVFAWKPAQLLFVAPLGLVFALFFLWHRDLPACIVAHFLVNAVGFLLIRLPR